MQVYPGIRTFEPRGNAIARSPAYKPTRPLASRKTRPPPKKNSICSENAALGQLPIGCCLARFCAGKGDRHLFCEAPNGTASGAVPAFQAKGACHLFRPAWHVEHEPLPRFNLGVLRASVVNQTPQFEPLHPSSLTPDRWPPAIRSRSAIRLRTVQTISFRSNQNDARRIYSLANRIFSGNTHST